MTEYASIEICRTLHQLRYFCDMRTIKIDSETIVATDNPREENKKIPLLKRPRIHEVSDWLRKRHKISILVECYPKNSSRRNKADNCVWVYRIYNKSKEPIAGKRGYNEYGYALEGAITQSLELLQA